MLSRTKKEKQYAVTRNADETSLKSEEFAFVFDLDGDIRCVQLPYHLDDNDELPYAVDKMIQLVADLELVTKLGRRYH